MPILGFTVPIKHDRFARPHALYQGFCLFEGIRGNTSREVSQIELEKLLARIAEHLAHARVHIEESGGPGIKDEDAVVDGIEDGTEALLAFAKPSLCCIGGGRVDPNREQIVVAIVYEMPGAPANGTHFAAFVEHAKFESREPCSECLPNFYSQCVAFALDCDRACIQPL